MTFKIAILIGSLRKESYSRRIAKLLISIAPDTLLPEILEIGDLALYNQDLENTPPPEWISFRKRLSEFAGVIFVTPEYNRSVPGVLKNAIDIGSRPPANNAWNGMAGAVVSVSPGAMGAFGANHHLRQMLVFLNVPAMAQPEIYISHVNKLFDANGHFNDEGTLNFLKSCMAAYALWVGENARSPIN
jgi:chromate reductase, NAD(P)H dehydrogenase (quinone)